MTKRTMSMELRAIRASVDESPPPPSAGMSVREWFAGLAMMNPELMRDLAPGERAGEAVRLADELIRALATPGLPSQESLAAPTEAVMAEWDKKIADDNDVRARRGRETQPAGKNVRKQTARYDLGMLPPPLTSSPELPHVDATTHFRRASDHLRQASMPPVAPATPTVPHKKSPPSPTQYSSFNSTNEEE
jgi:hypothetical protein